MILELEKCYNEKGRYMGSIIVDTEALTLEYLDKIKADKADKLGWKKYHRILKEKGYNIEV